MCTNHLKTYKSVCPFRDDPEDLQRCQPRHPYSFAVTKTRSSHGMVSLIRFLVVVGMIILILQVDAIFPSLAKAEETGQIYWGANIVGGVYNLPRPPEDMRAVYRFEEHAQKKVSLIGFGRHWQSGGVWQPFPKAAFDNIRNNGSIPVLTWGSDNGSAPNQPPFRNAVIASGQYDDYIRQFATDAKNWGHPFFLRFNWEMDGWWYPWGEGKLSNGTIVNGNNAGDYVLAWNHVRNIFREVGATNVTWVWCVNHESTTWQYPPLPQIYPGDENVDWTAIDPYNRYDGTWLTFDQTIRGTGVDWMSNIYEKLLTVAPSKPVMLAEYASMEDLSDPQGKANWIRDAHLTQLPLYYPEIKAVLWFNDEGLQIESSANAQAAFAETINTSYFASNDFGNISASPILPIQQPILPEPTATPTVPPTATPVASTTYVEDTFSRSVTDGWGSAELGGPYTLTGSSANFDVTGDSATINLTKANVTRTATLANISARDVDITVRLTTSKLAVGGGQMVYLVARRVSGTADYLGRIRFLANGSMGLQLIRESGGATLLGRENVVPGLTHTPNNYVWLRMQVLGSNPTTLRMKAWADGQAELTTWLISLTDTTTSLQYPGAVGLRAYLSATTSNAPVLFTIDDFRVVSVSP